MSSACFSTYSRSLLFRASRIWGSTSWVGDVEPDEAIVDTPSVCEGCGELAVPSTFGDGEPDDEDVLVEPGP